MPSYVFEFSAQRGEREFSQCWSARVYENDAGAIRSARRMFRNRTDDANDELAIYEGQKNGWGSADGRYVGKVAYNSLGTATTFIPA